MQPRKHESTKRTNDRLTSVVLSRVSRSWVLRLGPRVGCGQHRLAGDRQLDRERRRAAIALRREERLEDVPLDRFGHAAAGIADDEARHRIARGEGKTHDHLFELTRVHYDPEPFGIEPSERSV